MEEKRTLRPSIIHDFFPNSLLKKLYYMAWRSDIQDINEKADYVREMLGPDFHELGCGTNRIVFLRNGIAFKIALDNPGFTDNLTELKRCSEKQYLPKVFECNYLIVAEEYWTYMDQDTFMENEAGILEILADLAEDYIFDDIGFISKNYCNWGFREKMNADGEPDGEIGILDFGYLYPKVNQTEAMSCPICGGELKYNKIYTGFVCQNRSCHHEYTPDDVIARMDLTLDDLETQMFAMVSEVPEPIIRHTKKG